MTQKSYHENEKMICVFLLWSQESFVLRGKNNEENENPLKGQYSNRF